MRARNAPSLNLIVMLGAILQAGGSILNNAMSMHFQRQEAEKARLFNAEQAAIQRDWQESMWNKNNAYNSPVAQMQRARDAGLNPSMLYGQPIAESSQATGGAEASTSIPSVPGLSNPFDGFALLSAQRDLIEAQADEVRSRIPLNQQRVNESVARVGDLLESVELKKKQIEALGSQIQLTDAQRENISFEQMMKKGYLDIEYGKYGLLKQKTEAEISKMNAERREILARAKVSERELSEMIYSFSLRMSGLAAQNRLTEAQIRQADATAAKLQKEGVRLDQIIDIDSVKADQKRSIMNALNSDNPIDNLGGLILYGVEYAAGQIQSFVPLKN